MKLKPRIKKLWLKNLRSGAYVQGKRTLCRETSKGDKFCCLGVLTDLYLREKGKYWEKDESCFPINKNDLNFDGEDQYLPYKVEKWAFIEESNYPIGDPIEILMSMNDGGDSFKKIANWIEKKL